MNTYPQRKPNRLREFDYSSPNAYFITICIRDRRCLLGDVVGASIARPPCVTLSHIGCVVEHAISAIPTHYPMLTVEKYTIMPNHVHMLLSVSGDENGRAMLAPTISHVIQHLKGTVTKQIGSTIWQKSFHDHIVRTERDYQMIWQYIDTNPINWESDCFYTP